MCLLCMVSTLRGPIANQHGLPFGYNFLNLPQTMTKWCQRDHDDLHGRREKAEQSPHRRRCHEKLHRRHRVQRCQPGSHLFFRRAVYAKRCHSVLLRLYHQRPLRQRVAELPRQWGISDFFGGYALLSFRDVDGGHGGEFAGQ